VKLRLAVVEETEVAEVAVTTGATASVTVTAIVCGDPVSEVCKLPASSEIAKVPADVSVELVAPAPLNAEEIALMVQTVAEL
jgi:hypothetical protein